MNLPFLEDSQKLLDIAFSQGRKNALNYPTQKTKFYTLKGKEIAKIIASSDYLEERLFGVVKKFPNIENLEPFYKDLFECIIDTNEIRKTLSSISSVSALIKKQRVLAIKKIKELPFEKRADLKKISSEYFGRVSSLVKSLSKNISEYNDCVKKLRELPSIKTSEEVIIFAGFPNAGKSTLMRKLTGSKVKVAPYPFTTKGLNVGIFEKKHLPVQVIDTPGLLDREIHKRNKIELKAITALQHLKGTIVFVIDSTQEITPQEKLFLELKKLFPEKKFVLVLNKADVVEKEKINNLKEHFSKFGYPIIIEGINIENLKEFFLN